MQIVDGDGDGFAQRHGDEVEAERRRDDEDASHHQVLRPGEQHGDDEQAGEERGAEVHEGDRLAARIVAELAAWTDLVLLVGEDPAEYGTLAAARTAELERPA